MVVWSNWILLGVLTAVSLLLAADSGVIRGVLFGGIIVTVNFHMLARTLFRALKPPHLGTVQSVIAKYYLRFSLSGVLIFILILFHWVEPLGLILGLSIVVISLFLATIVELIKFFSNKEAV